MNPVTITRITVMIIGGIIAIIGMNKHKQGAGWGQPLAVIGAIVAIIAALWGIKRVVAGDERKEMRAREFAYQKVETRIMGKYLAEHFAGKKVVIVKDSMRYQANPDGSTSTDYPLEGLKEGLGSALTIVKEILPAQAGGSKAPAGAPAGMPAMMMPQSMWYTSDMLAKDLPAENTYDIIVFLAGVPSDALSNRSKIKDILKKKKIAMISGEFRLYPELFRTKTAVCAVIYNPKAEYDDSPIPGNDQKAFDKRFLMMTEETYQKIVQDNTSLFSI